MYYKTMRINNDISFGAKKPIIRRLDDINRSFIQDYSFVKSPTKLLTRFEKKGKNILAVENEKYREIARAMGVAGVDNMSVEEYRKAAIDAVKQLSVDVGIPTDLKDIVKPEDIPFLAQSAYDDACRPGNPKETSVADITKLYESLM